MFDSTQAAEVMGPRTQTRERHQ
ncbi:hypothetical protein HaLaN_15034 [Haematococcus lacustris]|uniref:Uncharacterized protein n=1 Tax=Haematococcus lacustris TaxID=44745 RepID=A0A699Z7X0_HAELA|nr:hypothetical protein HaLaN_15034 [Haematococcus lacustris]